MDIVERLEVMAKDTIGEEAAGEIRSLRFVVADAKKEIERLRAELSEAMARERSMQGLVVDCLVAASQAIADRDDVTAQRYLREVLVENAKPRDHSTLDDLLAQARADERERVKQRILGGCFLHDAAPAKQFAREVATMIDTME